MTVSLRALVDPAHTAIVTQECQGAYADAVIDNTLSLLATITTTDGLVAEWQSSIKTC